LFCFFTCVCLWGLNSATHLLGQCATTWAIPLPLSVFWDGGYADLELRSISTNLEDEYIIRPGKIDGNFFFFFKSKPLGPFTHLASLCFLFSSLPTLYTLPFNYRSVHSLLSIHYLLITGLFAFDSFPFPESHLMGSHSLQPPQTGSLPSETVPLMF
jgi:hypothetical protein